MIVATPKVKEQTGIDMLESSECIPQIWMVVSHSYRLYLGYPIRMSTKMAKY